jgi:hypothetical protein
VAVSLSGDQGRQPIWARGAVWIGENDQVASRQADTAIARCMWQEPLRRLLENGFRVMLGDDLSGGVFLRAVHNDDFKVRQGLQPQRIEAGADGVV